MWNLPPPPGFQALDPHRPVTKYFRLLPHWRQEGATYFVTFRLADSLPQSKLAELRHFRQEWERRHPPPRSNEADLELSREVMRRVEKWLDAGMGSCVLKSPSVSSMVTQALHHFDQVRYHLGCYVVMPNHVHALVRPLVPDLFPLEDVTGAWKQFSSREINQLLGQEGPLWQEESFDRIIRDEEHLCRVIQYIGSNPERAGLPRESCPLWIRHEWVVAGWKFPWM